MTLIAGGERVDSSPAAYPARTRFEGRHVTIAPLDPVSHSEALYQGSCGAENDYLWKFLFNGPFANRDEFHLYLEAKARSEDPLFFAILENESGTALGHAAYMRIEPAHRVIEVGSILYTRRLQRTIGATEAMYLMARHAFEELGYRRYEWKCDALNEPSRKAALRLGFQFEGIFRQHMIVKDRNRDTAWFSMLDKEWPLCKRAFEAWLEPQNFDAAGHQKRPLTEFRRP